MTLDLFDVQAGFGGSAPGVRSGPTAAEYEAEMRRLAIGGALVRIAPDELDTDIVLSNRKLAEACRASPALVPCPILMPNTAGDVAPEAEQVAAAIAVGAGAAHLRPGRDAWILKRWVCGSLFRALEARRLPAYCLERLIPPEAVADLAADYPQLPFILAEGNYRAQRVYLPLLEHFPNVYLSLGNNNDVHMAIEQMVRRVGAGRLLFGTGFPVSDPMPAITMLTYAGIPDADKALIGAGNMRRLMEGIIR